MTVLEVYFFIADKSFHIVELDLDMSTLGMTELCLERVKSWLVGYPIES